MKTSSVNIVGRVASEPILRMTKNDNYFLALKIAENRKEETLWHTVHFWGKVAENHTKYVKKGMQVTLLGAEMSQLNHDGKDGFKTIETIFVGGDLIYHADSKSVYRAS